MKISKLNINKILTIFLFSHLIIWTLVPSISNNNLPLDVIEAIAWGYGWPLGWEKHPPLSSWFPELFFQIFGNQDWAYYLLSQLFVIFSFFIIFKFSEDFFKNKILSLISVLLLESIYFYNFTSPEFNVNVCQLPFWALTVYFCWRGIKQNDIISWLLFGFFAGLGFLSKYLFIYLLIAMDVFFIYLLIKKKINLKCLISLITFFLVLTPHLIWLTENNYITITYALQRTGINDPSYLDHLIYPMTFLGKQAGILILFFIMLLFLTTKLKKKFNLKDKKLLFLLTINILPIFLIFLTSILMGAKIRTMWMTPFYLFIGVLFVYIFQNKINLKKLKYFFSIFLFLFILSPAIYFYISVTQTDKRTDYPGKKISQTVQKEWNNNFTNKIGLVGGDEWHGGNLSYHLKSRPRWDNILRGKKNILLNDAEDGFVLIGDSDILQKICSGVFFEVEKQGICMVGKKK
tara:strand:- start:579 stop:1961 length:1383 start_codon:yes stop_codon:yes gene_type:complete